MNQPQRREAQRKATDSEPLLTRRQSIVLVIILVAILGFPAFQMADDWRLHTQGVLATSSHCTVVHVVSSRNDWDELHIDYVTADGVRQEHTDSLVLWLSRPDPTSLAKCVTARPLPGGTAPTGPSIRRLPAWPGWCSWHSRPPGC